MKVLLAGAGGDDIFTGYRRHTALMQERYWTWLPLQARRLLARGARRLPVRSQLTRRLAKAFQFADRDGDARLASYLDFAPPELTATLYTEETRAGLAGEPAERLLLEALERLPAHTPRLHRMLYLDAKFYLTDHNLNYMDKMAMASGVEVRVPILDPDLVALAARLPPDLKQRGTTGKWIFRKAMEPLLPREVIYRGKVGFGAPLRHWIRHPLRPLVDDVLSEASLRQRGLFDARRVRGMIERDRAGRLDAAYPIFALICVELWCRMFVDPPAPTLNWEG
jgi:asparagine synthase (glutamine-hydrolysing)